MSKRPVARRPTKKESLPEFVTLGTGEEAITIPYKLASTLYELGTANAQEWFPAFTLKTKHNDVTYIIEIREPEESDEPDVTGVDKTYEEELELVDDDGLLVEIVVGDESTTMSRDDFWTDIKGLGIKKHRKLSNFTFIDDGSSIEVRRKRVTDKGMHTMISLPSNATRNKKKVVDGQEKIEEVSVPLFEYDLGEFSNVHQSQGLQILNRIF